MVNKFLYSTNNSYSLHLTTKGMSVTFIQKWGYQFPCQCYTCVHISHSPHKMAATIVKLFYPKLNQWRRQMLSFSLGVGMGVDPDKKVGGDNKMMCRTSMYAVHEYQTSKAGVIIESNFGGLRCFSLSLYSFSSPPFCPTFKTRSLSLRAGVSRVSQWVRATPGR